MKKNKNLVQKIQNNETRITSVVVFYRFPNNLRHKFHFGTDATFSFSTYIPRKFTQILALFCRRTGKIVKINMYLFE